MKADTTSRSRRPPYRMALASIVVAISVGVPDALLAQVRVQLDRGARVDSLPQNIQVIAVAPAVTYAENDVVRMGVADLWFNRSMQQPPRWLPAEMTWDAFGRDLTERNQIRVRFETQVRNNFAVDAGWTADLLRRMRCQGLLCLRVDRWEEGPGSPRIVYVALKAVLIDSLARPVWKSSGSGSFAPGKADPARPVELGGSSPPGNLSEPRVAITPTGQSYVDSRTVRVNTRVSEKVPEAGGDLPLQRQLITDMPADYVMVVDSLLTKMLRAFPRKSP